MLKMIKITYAHCDLDDQNEIIQYQWWHYVINWSIYLIITLRVGKCPNEYNYRYYFNILLEHVTVLPNMAKIYKAIWITSAEAKAHAVANG